MQFYGERLCGALPSRPAASSTQRAPCYALPGVQARSIWLLVETVTESTGGSGVALDEDWRMVMASCLMCPANPLLYTKKHHETSKVTDRIRFVSTRGGFILEINKPEKKRKKQAKKTPAKQKATKKAKNSKNKSNQKKHKQNTEGSLEGPGRVSVGQGSFLVPGQM